MAQDYPEVPLLFADPIKEDSVKKTKRFARKLKVPKNYFCKDSFGAVGSKFSMDKRGYPTIFGINGSEYLFIVKGLDSASLGKIKEKVSMNWTIYIMYNPAVLKYRLVLAFFFLFFPLISFAQSQPGAIVATVGASGEIKDTHKHFLQNELESELSKSYKLLKRDGPPPKKWSTL